MVNIFIANLDWEITSEDLKTTFSAFGEVTYAHVVFEKDTKRSRGFGYVEMVEADHAINAITALNGMEVNGRKLDVKVASPKENRPPRKEVRKKVHPKRNVPSGQNPSAYKKHRPGVRNPNM
jgi:RNA recognition motif-containing protein